MRKKSWLQLGGHEISSHSAPHAVRMAIPPSGTVSSPVTWKKAGMDHIRMSVPKLMGKKSNMLKRALHVHRQTCNSKRYMHPHAHSSTIHNSHGLNVHQQMNG